MRCEAVREALSVARESGALDAAARAHMESCSECRAWSISLRGLDRVLAADETVEPGPGFDTRMFARLEERRRRGRRWRWALAAAGVPAVAAVAILLFARSDARITAEEDLELAMNLDMLEDMALLHQLDEVEAYDVLLHVDLAEIESVGGGAR